MQGHKGRRDAARFLEAWAPDLSALTMQGWPMLRYAGPRTIASFPGILLTAPRNASARYDAPLNAFLALSPEGLAAFFRDDLIGYARFNASVRWLGTYCLRHDVDLGGGSQRGPRTRIVSLDPIFDPALEAAAHVARAMAVPDDAFLAPDARGTMPHPTDGLPDETSGNAI